MFNILRNTLTLLLSLLIITSCFTQNSMVGDGFGGRKWYTPTNYGVGSYSAFSLCYEDTCAPHSNKLFGWGDDIYSTLGIVGPGTNTPVSIPNMNDVAYFSSGYYTGAIKKDGTGWAWGNLSSIGAVISFSPIQVISHVKFVSACSGVISFIKKDGTVWSIGLNTNGNFGDGNINSNPTNIPIQMSNITNAVRISNNRSVTIVLLEDSTVWSVGSSGTGGLGHGFSISQLLAPTQIIALPKIIDIKTNALGTIALSDSGFVYFFGAHYSGGTQEYTPIKLPNLSNIVAISGTDDGHFFYALDENKNLFAWGRNDLGQCGLPSANTNIVTPQLVETNVIDIMAGESFGYIVKDDSSLWATGAGFTPFSIWLNLSNIPRDAFTLLDPSQVPGACHIFVGGLPCDPNDYLENDSIYFPNVFTPNGDNSNDNFYFPNWGVEELKCDIYNRWGTLIYQWNGIDGFWDGRTTSGKECSDGVYYYIASYKRLVSENWEKHTGYVSLLR